MMQICVLISGNGSNLQALIDAIKSKAIPNAQINLVISNKKAAFGLTRASLENIPTIIHSLKGKERLAYDEQLAEIVLAANPDLIVLAGFMHILSSQFLDALMGKPIINLHPALPGAFDGTNAISRAYDAFQDGKITKTGVMIHEVIAKVDQGQVVCVQEIPIKDNDTLQDVERAIHLVEHELIVRGVCIILRQIHDIK